MNSKIVKELKLKDSPIALLLTNEKPRLALQFKEGAGWWMCSCNDGCCS